MSASTHEETVQLSREDLLRVSKKLLDKLELMAESPEVFTPKDIRDTIDILMKHANPRQAGHPSELSAIAQGAVLGAFKAIGDMVGARIDLTEEDLSPRDVTPEPEPVAIEAPKKSTSKRRKKGAAFEELADDLEQSSRREYR